MVNYGTKSKTTTKKDDNISPQKRHNFFTGSNEQQYKIELSSVYERAYRVDETRCSMQPDFDNFILGFDHHVSIKHSHSNQYHQPKLSTNIPVSESSAMAIIRGKRDKANILTETDCTEIPLNFNDSQLRVPLLAMHDPTTKACKVVSYDQRSSADWNISINTELIYINHQ